MNEFKTYLEIKQVGCDYLFDLGSEIEEGGKEEVSVSVS